VEAARSFASKMKEDLGQSRDTLRSNRTSERKKKPKLKQSLVGRRESKDSSRKSKKRRKGPGSESDSL
jgi:hypothetical protein